MKIRTFSVLLIGLLAVSLLAGCSARAAEEKLDAVEDVVEHRLDTVEDAVEEAVIQAILPEPAAPAPAATPPATTPAETTPPIPTVPAEPAATEAALRLTAEEAQAIALQHAGFADDQVQFLRTEYEIDDRVPQYDIQFHEGRWEYEYEIHAETGAVLSFEKDD